MSRSIFPTEIRRNSIEEEARFLLEESRIVVPGIQALFGFQLIAVFNDSFREMLTHSEQVAHVFAILSVVVAMVLCLAPTAFHRLAEPGSVSLRFLHYSSTTLALSMAALRIGICIDFFLIVRIVTGDFWMSGLASGALFLFCYALWSVLPRLIRRTNSQFAR